MNPRWLYHYSCFVTIISALLLALYLCVSGYLAYRLANPLFPQQDDLTYELLHHAQVRYNMNAEDWETFMTLEKEEFHAKKPVYYAMAQDATARYLKQRLAQAGVYTILWALVLWMHIGIWRTCRQV